MLGKREPPRLAVDDVHAELREQPEDAARLRRARRVVVAGDDDDRRVGQRATQPRELHERVQDRRVGRPHGVKHVARDDDQLGRELDDAVDRRAKRRGDVRLPLVDPAGSEPLVLPVAEVEIGEVDQAHDGKLGRSFSRSVTFDRRSSPVDLVR